MSDGPSNQWSFPEITIGAGAYLVVFASGKDRKPSPVTVVGGVSNLHTSFQLERNGEYLALQDPDGTASSLFDPEYPTQIADVSYGRYGSGEAFRYFTTPTPGRTNGGTVYEGVVADTSFSVDRGFYTDPFEVTIATETVSATIRYTLDGSAPTISHGSVYAAPIDISGTAVLRAAAFRSTWLPTNVDTQTYIFVDDVITQSPGGEAPGPDWPGGLVNGQVLDYGMDAGVVYDSRYVDLMDDALLSVPSVSLVTDVSNLFDPGTGIYVNAIEDGREWERPASVELINPDGSDGFQVEAGLRIRGGFSRQDFNPKHAFRLFFRSEYGDDKLRFPLFGDEGADQFDKVDLRTAMNYSWSIGSSRLNTMVRDVFNRDAQRDMGQPYTRSRYYHLYINGVYWGLYQTQERPEARYAETYFGGDKDDYDVVKVDSGLTLDVNDVQSYRPYTMVATDGNLAAWHRLWEAANAGFDSDESYYRAQGLNADGTANSSYEVLLDVDNLADYMLIIFYGGNIDSPITRFGSENVPNNVYAIYNRANPDGFRSFIHDAEHTMLVGDLHGYGDELYTDRTGPFPAGTNRDYSNPQWLHQQLAVHPEYRMRFADRAHRVFFNDGALTPAASEARLMSRANEIDLAIIAESARWGDTAVDPGRTKHDDWLPAINDIVDIWIPNRTDIVLGQLESKRWYPEVDAPVFSINGANQHGGDVSAGDVLTMVNPGGSGTIYYTLDGSDPRLPGTYAWSYTAVVAENAAKRILVPATEGSLYQGGQFTVTFYKATIPISSVDTAFRQVIRKPANQSSVVRQTAAVVNFLNTGPSAHYASDSPFPGTTIGSDVDDFAVEVSGAIYIPEAGEWTFGVNSDDGFYLSVGGREMSSGGRAPADTLAVFSFPAAGAYPVYLLSYDRAGGSELELFAAQGSFGSWNGADFDLVGDTANGGLEVLGTAWTSLDFDDSSWIQRHWGRRLRNGCILCRNGDLL